MGVTSVGELLREARRRLAQAGIPSPAEEVRLLMAECLGVSLAWVMAHAESTVQPDRRSWFESGVARRSAFEPMAYILGHREFFGLDFQVSPEVLIPRPETELLVEKALTAAAQLLRHGDRDLLVVELGTGSGAVAVSLATREPRLKVIAVDSSPSAIAVAGANAGRHGVQGKIAFRTGDLLGPVGETIDLLVANLPYIPSGLFVDLMADVREYEPREALDGGPGGTTITRRALEQSVSKMRRPGTMLFEIGDGQGASLTEIARRLYPEAQVSVHRDYAGFERNLVVDLI